MSAPGVKGGETISGGCILLINWGRSPASCSPEGVTCMLGNALAVLVVSGATRAAIDPPLGRHWMCAKNMLVYSENFNISFYYFANKLKRRTPKACAVDLCNHAFNASQTAVVLITLRLDIKFTYFISAPSSVVFFAYLCLSHNS